ncbi:hypothetical protein KKD70_01680 [Patescibacteria group bacterium]|nr:hypothetical protein [Patescibacteria group bacterium]
MVFNLGQNFDDLNGYIADIKSRQAYVPYGFNKPTEPAKQETQENVINSSVETKSSNSKELDLRKRISTLALMVASLEQKNQTHKMKLKTSAIMLMSLLNRPQVHPQIIETTKEIPVVIQSVIEILVEKPMNINESLDAILNECCDDYQKQKVVNALFNGLHPDRTGIQNENQTMLMEHLIKLRCQLKNS